jgi:hypothetical protein
MFTALVNFRGPTMLYNFVDDADLSRVSATEYESLLILIGTVLRSCLGTLSPEDQQRTLEDLRENLTLADIRSNSTDIELGEATGRISARLLQVMRVEATRAMIQRAYAHHHYL